MKRFVHAALGLSVSSLFSAVASAFVPGTDGQAIIPDAPAPTESMRFSGAKAIPRPGQNLVRIGTQSAQREAMSGLRASTKVDARTGAPAIVSGELPLTLSDAFGSEEAALRWARAARSDARSRTKMGRHLERHLRAFVRAHAGTLGVSTSGLVFNPDKFFADAHTVLASFDVRIKGTAVRGGAVNFRFSNGRLVQIALKTFDAASLAEGLTAPKALPPQAALRVARSVLGPDAAVRADSVKALFVPRVRDDGKGYALVPAVSLEATSRGGEAFVILKHADSDEILEWHSLHLYAASARVTGRINERNHSGSQSTVAMPFVSASNGGWWGGRSVAADKDGVLDLTQANGLKVSLSSARFSVLNSGGSTASVKLEGDVLFDAESNSTLAETTTFHHLNVIQDMVSGYITPDWFKRQLKANVNIRDYCNAFWNGSTVNFFSAGTKRRGNGETVTCKNTGEIADVVYHEWGHGLDANTGGISDSAFSEGIGDITSMLMTGSPQVGPGFFEDGKPVRDMDGEYKYPPTADDREPHEEGLIIGATYYHLTQALVEKYGADVGRQTARKLFFKSLYTADEYTDMYDALLAIDSDGGAPEQGANYCLINAAFARHGLTQAADGCARE